MDTFKPLKQPNDREKRLGAFMYALLGTLAELGPTPAGIVYAGLMTNGCSWADWEELLRVTLHSGLVEQANNVLTATPKGRIIAKALDAAMTRHSDSETIAPANTWLA